MMRQWQRSVREPDTTDVQRLPLNRFASSNRHVLALKVDESEA